MLPVLTWGHGRLAMQDGVHVPLVIAVKASAVSTVALHCIWDCPTCNRAQFSTQVSLRARCEAMHSR